MIFEIINLIIMATCYILLMRSYHKNIDEAYATSNKLTHASFEAVEECNNTCIDIFTKMAADYAESTRLLQNRVINLENKLDVLLAAAKKKTKKVKETPKIKEAPKKESE